MKSWQQVQFEEAYEAYSEPIFRYCYFKLHDRELAKDITHETFVKTWSYIQAQNTINNWQAFLYTTARRLIINEYARQEKRPTGSLEAIIDQSGFEPHDEKNANSEQKSEGRLLLEKLRKIDSEAAELLLMRFVDDLPVKSIAAILGISVTATSVRIHRALKNLKKIYHNN